MPAGQVPQALKKLLDDGKIEEATAILATASAKLAETPRALLPLLEGLDRERKNDALVAVAVKLQELGILPIEGALFEMRVKMRQAAYPAALRLIEKILTSG